MSANNEDQVKSISTWKKAQSTVVMVAAIMISLGQWGDTKDVAISAYTSFIENFTHKLQYNQIEKINIGNSTSYAKSLFGEPNVIKRSKIDTDIEFYYYIEKKFIFTIMTSDRRVDGYSVLSRVEDFSPQIPFSESLGQTTISAASLNDFQYSFDAGNLVYYLESQNLGKNKMYLSVSKGFIEYAAIPISIENPMLYSSSVKAKILSIDSLATFSENKNKLKSEIEELRKKIQPNYYAITELKNNVIAESLLTRFEYQTFTKS
ncbi:hypothetical protein NQU47_03800 [Pseudoalteromonas distincta]|uniref:ETEC_3214 domain-containing protein n=1 Tax=Pseudoalteromonas distincta TaxID=77608 RepID=UPI00233FD932|nr:ETEC_3214 domain-containing protein [Pseudoalteromonas distincta]MDC3211680.1 hypothetical protein [Pseudoalteromonas distincta]